MSNVKTKISLIAVVMILVLAISSVFAATKENIRVDYTLEYNGVLGTKTLQNGNTLEGVKAGDKITLTAKCTDSRATYWSQHTNFMKEKGYTFNRDGMAFIGYMFDSKDAKDYKVDYSKPTTLTVTIPNYAKGETHILRMEAVAACDGLVDGDKELEAVTGTIAIKLVMNNGTTPVAEEKITLSNGKSGNNATVTAKVENGTFKKFTYKWDNDKEKDVTTNPLVTAIPTEVGKHTLTVTGYTNNNVSSTKSWVYEVKEVVPENDDLIVEDYMKENKDLDTLAVSLRNDSDEYDKENKNVYALGEEVVYYVDYKNGGNDIKKEVKIVLQLPLEFKAVSTYGGKVDSDKKTITWTFENGLEKDAAGTKIVKVQYTALSRNSKKAEVVYPVAKIYNQNKEKDASAVINYIFRDEDTEIPEDHFPYMYGDKNKTTFRPDDGISRAEGALVLARIFGINYTGTTVVGDEFVDLADTYVEAQRAIVACSKIGIINGYTDGSYKPNNKMTRAEFMKIIASYIEVNAEDDDIDGLEVKVDNNIKVYKNPTNVYMTGSTTTSTHWAINYVTLLCRLNMTSVSDSNKNLRLDENITRAEVAQLVNFYLLRAPAESGKTQFSDVAKNHKLFADILEATRPAHTYYLTSEGTEVAEYDD